IASDHSPRVTVGRPHSPVRIGQVLCVGGELDGCPHGPVLADLPDPVVTEGCTPDEAAPDGDAAEAFLEAVQGRRYLVRARVDLRELRNVGLIDVARDPKRAV